MRGLLVAIALCGLVAAGCGGESAETGMSTTPPEATGPPEASSRPPAPALEGVGLDGERISLAGYRGRPVFVNVWSSW